MRKKEKNRQRKLEPETRWENSTMNEIMMSLRRSQFAIIETRDLVRNYIRKDGQPKTIGRADLLRRIIACLDSAETCVTESGSWAEQFCFDEIAQPDNW